MGGGWGMQAKKYSNSDNLLLDNYCQENFEKIFCRQKTLCTKQCLCRKHCGKRYAENAMQQK